MTKTHCNSHSQHCHTHHHINNFGYNRQQNSGSTLSNAASKFETQLDGMSNSLIQPFIGNGIYHLRGSHTHVMSHLSQQVNQFPTGTITNPNTNQHDKNISSSPIQNQNFSQGKFLVIGQKTSPSNDCYFIALVIIGVFLIIPLFFLCCVCCRKRSYPKYQLSLHFYQLLAAFLREHPQCTTLNLTVADNAFGKEKAQVLLETLSRREMVNFTFSNLAYPCNHIQNEADDFGTNMMAIKGLGFTSQISWEDMVV